MTIRSIQYSESMDAVWDELVYTEARLLKSPPAHEQATVFKDLLGRWEKVSTGQRQMWRAELVAQAAVDSEDESLDALVDNVEASLQRATHRDRRDPRYQRYFKRPRNEVLRQGLETELETVRDWPKSLRSEPEAELQALGEKLDKQIESGDDTIAARRAAAAACADHRVRDINAFIDAVNGARQAVYGALVIIGQKAGRPKTWAEGFFRKRPAARPADPATAAA